MVPSPRRLARKSAAYKTGVEAAGYGGVSGSFDDGAAVGKQRHLVGVSPELEDKVIVAHGPVGLEPLSQPVIVSTQEVLAHIA